MELHRLNACSIKTPDVSNLRVFGCLVYAHMPASQRKKFSEKSKKCIFIGYPEGTKGYKLFDVLSQKFFRSRDAVFLEKRFYDLKGNENKQFGNFYTPLEEKIDEPHEIPMEEFAQEENNEIENPVEADQHLQPVGATYEENFFRETQSLPRKRISRPPNRFDEENYFSQRRLC